LGRFVERTFLTGSQGAFPKHLDHAIELAVGELGDDILEQKFFRHDRADELHKFMRPFPPHREHRRLALRHRAALFGGFIPKFQDIFEHAVC